MIEVDSILFMSSSGDGAWAPIYSIESIRDISRHRYDPAWETRPMFCQQLDFDELSPLEASTADFEVRALPPQDAIQ